MPILADGYRDELTLRAARAEYFAASGFDESSYEDDWVRLQAGPIPLFFPNSSQRVRSVRVHDLHHPLTEYDTSWTGEAEIGAWEIASGCADHYAAWVLNLGAMAIGLFIAPGRVWRAFVRGCRSRNLYRGEIDDALLEEAVGDLRARLGLRSSTTGATVAEVLRFVAWSVLSLATLATVVALSFSLILLAGGFVYGLLTALASGT